MNVLKKVLLLVVVGAVAFGWYHFRGTSTVIKPEIVTAAVSSGPVVETVRAIGTLEPLRRVSVGSQVSGVVKEIYADFNSIVHAGQLIAEIDPSLLEVQAQIQAANVDRQKGDIASQELQLEDQRRQLDRLRALHEKGLQTDQQLEAAVLAVKTREASIASARKQLVQSEANLAAARLNVSYTKIYSPIDGVVIRRRVDRGQTVQASTSTPSFYELCTPLEVLKLNAGVDEANVGRVRPGQTVRFRVDTYGDRYFTGTVDAVRLNARVVENVVTYPVWISVPNDTLELRPGMTAHVFIEVSKVDEAVRIPAEALRFRPTRAMYAALGIDAPAAGPVRAVDLAGDRVVDPSALRAEVIDENAESIDELFSPLPRADSRATVWTWDETAREFTSITVRIGVSDGEVSELLDGDVKTGDHLVTQVILPFVPGARPNQNPLMGGRGRGGR